MVLTLDVLHADFPNRRWAELRFPLTSSIQSVKEKLERSTGTPPSAMKLYAFKEEQKAETSIALIDDSKTLSFYNVTSGMCLFIVDMNGSSNNWDTPISEETKYKLDEKVYNQKKNSARSFLKDLKNKKPELFFNKKKAATTLTDHEVTDIIMKVPIGSRCEIKSCGDVRGEICWIGKRPGHAGYWLGCRLDEPVGNFNGVDDGEFLFNCTPGYGHLLELTSTTLSTDVHVGNFPPVDPFTLDEV